MSQSAPAAPNGSAPTRPPILIGTSGFSYDDWRGVFYPPGLARAHMLDYYAGVFPALEINATYYRTPNRKTAESMVERAAGRLEFSIKAPGALTHEGNLGDAVLLPWSDFLQPFAESGRLAAILLQFPAAFRASDTTWRFLERLCARLGPLPLVVELRHDSWDAAPALRRLTDWQLSRAMVDQPRLPGLSHSGPTPRTGPIAYLRLHGRNAESWYAGDAESSSARYFYQYRIEELEPWASAMNEAAAGAKTALAFFNNHPQGNAAANATQFASLLGLPHGSAGQGDLFQ